MFILARYGKVTANTDTPQPKEKKKMSRTFLLDIEGTVCPISFVKDILFPFFISQLPNLISQRGSQQSDTEIDRILNSFQIDNDDDLMDHISNLVSNDIKDSKLKELQGFVWTKGYEDGSIKAPIYNDAINLIKDPNNNIYIYSSGSIKAQKLLFKYACSFNDKESKMGGIDLTPYIKGYFDITTSGPKINTQSYENILNDIPSPDKDEEILFLSDNPLELDAAKKCRNIKIGLVLRDGNNPVDNKQDYPNYSNFNGL